MNKEMRKTAAGLLLAVSAAGILCMPAAATTPKCKYHPKARILVSTKEATCTAKASKTYKCAACRRVLKTETYGNKKEHTPGKTDCRITLNGTFTKAQGRFDGYEKHSVKCRKCGKVYEAGVSKFSYATKGWYFTYSKAVGQNRAEVARIMSNGKKKYIYGNVTSSFMSGINRKIVGRMVDGRKNRTNGYVSADLSVITANGLSYGRPLNGGWNISVRVR